MSATRRGRAAVIAGLLALPAAASADPVAITHEAPACVPAERYARVSATAAPADRVAAAELQFRGDEGGEVYAARMARGRDGSWSASLPRPLRHLKRVEYRIVMTATDAEKSTSPVFTVDVRPDCAGVDAASEVAEPIAVRVPVGAPPVPPVPPGFNPAGVVAVEGPPPRDKWRVAKWVAGAAAAAAVGAVAAGVTEGEEEVPPTPEFAITGTRPLPRGPISVREGMIVFVDVTGEPPEALTFTWHFSLRLGPQECLSMSDVATIGAERPLRLQLSAPLRANGFCGSAYSTDNVRLAIIVDGQTAREVVRALRFEVVP